MRVILNDQAADSLAQLIEQVKPALAAELVERPLGNLFRSHLETINDQRPNKLGGTRTNFFRKVSAATSTRRDGGTVTVNLAHVGIRQRFEGGTIRPTNGRKFLTIPARSEAYGTRASEHNFLVPIFFKSGAGALVERRKDDTTGAVLGGGVWFWLVKSVTQRPDPTVLPDRAAIVAASIKALDAWIAIKSKRAAAKAQKGGA